MQYETQELPFEKQPESMTYNQKVASIQKELVDTINAHRQEQQSVDAILKELQYLIDFYSSTIRKNE